MLKVKEELNELEQAYKGGNEASIGEELILLFAVVNVSRFLKVQPEFVPTATTNKFISRFEYVESSAQNQENSLLI